MIQESILDIFNLEIPQKELKENIMIYGTGTIAKEVYELLEKENYKIDCFLNKDSKHANAVKDLAKVKRPNDETITRERQEKSTVIIASFTPNADINKTIKELTYLGYDNIVTFMELFDIFENRFEERLYLNTKANFIKDKEIIIKASSLWNDKKSEDLYKDIVEFRMFKDHKNLLEKDLLEDQYCPKDITEMIDLDNMRLIDCGAFDGDTIETLISKVDCIDAIIAFEPDLDNYSKLLTNLRRYKANGKVKEISAFPCAVYSDSVQIKFNMEGSTGSNISDVGLSTIQCISIDQSIGDFKPTYIKMDIEGAEYEALLGAKKTIYKSKPNLAISLYHTPSDFYKIPLLIDSWNLGYKFYLRVYLYSAFELVLYAVK